LILSILQVIKRLKSIGTTIQIPVMPMACQWISSV